MGLFEDLWAAGAHNQEDRANQRVEWQDLQAINHLEGRTRHSRRTEFIA
jgi:hypothetical protein